MSNIPNFNQPPVSDIVNYTFYPWNYILTKINDRIATSERPIISYVESVSRQADGSAEYEIVAGENIWHSLLEFMHKKKKTYPYLTEVGEFDDSIETGIFGWMNPKGTVVEAHGSATAQIPNGNEEPIVDKVMKTLRVSSLALAIVMAKLGSTAPVSDRRPTKGSFELPSEYIAASAALCTGRARQCGPPNRRLTIMETKIVMPAVEAAKYL